MAGDENEREVMTLAEVADYLQLADRTIVRMAQRGEIPATKIASQWRFLRPVLRDWLAGQMQTMSPARLEALAGTQKDLLPLHEVIRPELMSLDLAAGPKESILRQLVEPLEQTGFARDPGRLLASLAQRERMMTTAVGHGVAIPHPRRPIPGMFPEPAIVLGRCLQGTDFEAVDDQLVHTFFLICATREEIHLQLMAKVSWLSRQRTLRKLQSASSAEAALAIAAQVGERLNKNEKITAD